MGRMDEGILKKGIVQAITMLLWLFFLKDADTYYIPYLAVGILSFLCFCMNCRDGYYMGESVKTISVKTGAALFSGIVLLANYTLWLEAGQVAFSVKGLIVLYRIALFILLGMGGYFTAWHILYYSVTSLVQDSLKKHSVQKVPPKMVFGISFLVISLLDIFILFACRYPGVLSPDSIYQVEQAVTGVYSNHHPYFHTVIIKFFIWAVTGLAGDMNAAVAAYHVFQILFMAMCFSLVSLTIYEAGAGLRVVIPVILWYAVMPFHIMYSFTMWKDVMFGGFVILFTVAAFRILRGVGKNKAADYTLLVISSLGFCLFRSNGLFAFVIVSIVFAWLFWKSHRRVCCLLFMIICISFLAKHCMLDALGVTQPDTVEALSIPLQQLARVAVDHNDFTEEQRELLGQVIDVGAIPGTYAPWISDPVKQLVRTKGNQQYLVDNKLAFAALYLETGLRHPVTYVKAWVDQTKGFWNAGYPYWRWLDDVIGNPYGIERTVNSALVDKCFNVYLNLFSNNRFLVLFLCIGFYTWVELFLLFLNIVRKDKIGWFLLVPNLAVLVSVVISTPVYAEFRYAYAVFCSLPFLAVITFVHRRHPA